MKTRTLWLLALFSLLPSCHVPRFFTRNFANITDHKIFPYTQVDTHKQPYRFAQGDMEWLDGMEIKGKKGALLSLNQYLKEETSTTAFLVVHRDSIVFENYYRGYEADDISNIFSVSKSITSLLVGIAFDDGLLESVEDPITKYLPELLDADPSFKELKLKHLLNMQSGFAFKESYLSPFADVAQLYYGTNQWKQIQKLEFEAKPGTKHRYQSIVTAVLGTLVERVTNMELGKYLEKKVWKPMGMEHEATWSVDDKRHRATKAYCCLNTTARDLAKIGRLYLNKGQWEGKQIVSESWIESSVIPNMENDCYQYQWYNIDGIASKEGQRLYYPDSLSAIQAADSLGLDYAQVQLDSKQQQWTIHLCSPEFYAQGILNQYIYVHPRREVIIIRLGKRWDRNYQPLFRSIARELGEGM